MPNYLIKLPQTLKRPWSLSNKKKWKPFTRRRKAHRAKKSLVSNDDPYEQELKKVWARLIIFEHGREEKYISKPCHQILWDGYK